MDSQLLPSLSLDLRKEPVISLLDTIHADIYAVANMEHSSKIVYNVITTSCHGVRED